MNHPDPVTAEAAQPAYDPVLAGLLQFAYPDVQANSQGHMTEDQRARLRQSRPRLVREDALMALAFGAIFLLLLIVVAPGGAVPACLGMTAILGLLTALSGWLAARKWIAIGADADAGRVESAEGEVRHHRVGGMVGSFGAVHQLKVGDRRFDLPQETVAVFREGAIYRVYFGPRSKVILSAAPVRVR